MAESLVSLSLRLLLPVLITATNVQFQLATDNGSPSSIHAIPDSTQSNAFQPLTPPLEPIANSNYGPAHYSLMEASSVGSGPRISYSQGTELESGCQHSIGWGSGPRISYSDCTESQSCFDDKQIVPGLNPNAVPFTSAFIGGVQLIPPSPLSELPTPHNAPTGHGLFQSLAQMMWNVQTSDHRIRDWLQFVAQCVHHRNCNEVDLCRSYPTYFKCNREGHLVVMLLGGCRLSGDLNLAAIPDTVITLRIRRNSLTKIGEWVGLKGKSLKHLDIQRNSELILNLSQLEMGREPLPLKSLVVSPMQIQEFFNQTDTRKWMMRSSLNSLTIKRHYDVIYFKNGTVHRGMRKPRWS